MSTCNNPIRFLLAALVLVMLGCGGPKPEVDPDAEEFVLSPDQKWEQIAGRGWEVIRLNRNAPIEGSYLDVHFAADGQVSGTGGCNTWFAVVAVRQGNRIRFNRLESTARECPSPAGIMEQEELFFELLRLADGFELKNDELTFYDGRKAVLTLLPKL